jgi:hypothetical protein
MDESLIACSFINVDAFQYSSTKVEVSVASIINNNEVSRIIVPNSAPVWLVTTLYWYQVVTSERQPICFNQIVCDRDVEKWQIIQSNKIRSGTYEFFSIHDRDIILKEIGRLIGN